MKIITGEIPFDVWLNGINVTGACTSAMFGPTAEGHIIVKDEDGKKREYMENFEVTTTIDGKKITLYRSPLSQ